MPLAGKVKRFYNSYFMLKINKYVDLFHGVGYIQTKILQVSLILAFEIKCKRKQISCS